MELLHHHLHWSWSRCLRLILSVPSCASLLSPVVVLFLLLLLLLCRHIVFVFFSMACAAYNNIYNSIYSHPYTDDVPTFHWYGSWFHSYRLFWATFFLFLCDLLPYTAKSNHIYHFHNNNNSKRLWHVLIQAVLTSLHQPLTEYVVLVEAYVVQTTPWQTVGPFVTHEK